MFKKILITFVTFSIHYLPAHEHRSNKQERAMRPDAPSSMPIQADLTILCYDEIEATQEIALSKICLAIPIVQSKLDELESKLDSLESTP